MSWKDTIQTIPHSDSKSSWRDSITTAPEKPSTLSALGTGAQQGATLGFADELAGAIDAALGKTGNLLVDKGGENPYKDQPATETYQKGRDAVRQELANAQAAHPVATTAGAVAGGVLPGILAGTGLGASAALGAAAGTGASEKNDISGVALDAAKGGALGAATSQLGKLLGKGVEAAQEGTPAVSSASTLAKVATGLKDEQLPPRLTLPEKPADYPLIRVQREEPKVYADASTPVPNIPDQSISDMVTNAVKGGMVSHVAGAMGIPGAKAAVGVPYALSRTPTAQRMAQSALQTAAPALKQVDQGVNYGADVIMRNFGNLSPEYQSILKSASSEGPRSVAVAHFLLSGRDPNYQKEMQGEQDDKTEPQK